MKRVLFLTFSLFGCASQIASNFTPYIVEVKSQAALYQDLDICRRYAIDYLSGRSVINPSQVTQKGATEAFSNFGYTVISPLAPALGALGGASGEALSELGLNSEEAKKIITICLHDKGQRSDNYHVYDPRY